MTEQPYEKSMEKADQILGFELFTRSWTVKEIANEVDRSEGTIRAWIKKYGWKLRRKTALKDIEQEMRDKTLEMRNKLLDISGYALDDVFIKNSDGEIVGIGVTVERIADVKTIGEIINRAGGVADKIDQTITKDVNLTGEVKVETIDPETAAAIGKMLAIKESEEIGEENDNPE